MNKTKAPARRKARPDSVNLSNLHSFSLAM